MKGFRIYGPYPHRKRWRARTVVDGIQSLHSFESEQAAARFLREKKIEFARQSGFDPDSLESMLAEFAEVALPAYWVYLLWRDGAPVYVGRTMNPGNRLLNHADKEFDRATISKALSARESSDLEAALIAHLRTEYNVALKA